MVLSGLAVGLVTGCGSSKPFKWTEPPPRPPPEHLPPETPRDLPAEHDAFWQEVDSWAVDCGGRTIELAACFDQPAPTCPMCRLIGPAVVRGIAYGRSVKSSLENRLYGTPLEIPLDGAAIRGESAAPITIVELADFTAPEYRETVQLLDAALAKHATSIRFASRVAPRRSQPLSQLAARAAIVAQSQGKYFELRAVLAREGVTGEAQLLAHAKTAGLDVERFVADLSSEATYARMERDIDIALDLGAIGAPAVFINGRRFDGFMDLDTWFEVELELVAHRSAK
jgi:protein-disulfide isomerase